MRRGSTLLLLGVLCAGCGAGRHADATTTTRVSTRPAGPVALRVALVGDLRIDLQGVEARRRTLADLRNAPLVLVDAASAGLPTAARVARAHPRSHFALIGASTAGDRVDNLVGVVLKDDEAAYVAGIAAGLSATEEGGATPRVAWVGPEERRLAAAFGRGVHAAAPDVAVLHQWSRAIAARCKEAALIGLGRGATIVMAHGGVCADAAAAAAHQQNLPALRLADFELPSVAAEVIVRDAVNGLYHGGEDLVFGTSSGAVGIRRLDPRIPIATAARARASAQALASGSIPSG